MTGIARPRPFGAYSSPLSSFARSNVKLANVPVPIALLLLTMLLPGELDFNLGVMRLSCQRLVLIAWFPVALTRLMLGKGVTLRSFDLLFISAFAYYAFAVFVKEPFDKAIVTGGIIFLEGAGGYLLARIYIRNSVQFLSSVKLLFVVVMILGAIAIPESIFFNHWAKNLAASISGAPSWEPGESRLGLLRAMAVFPHPIHYGAFCAGAFGLVWFTEPDVWKRLYRAGLVGLAAFFALSAGPMQGIVVALVGAVWERASRRIPGRVWMTIFLVTLWYFVLSLLTNRPPLRILVTSMVFDSGSAWYRMLIWDYGIENVLNSPWLGNPLGFWERPAWMPSDSVDNYWLAIAMWGGLPAAVLQAIGIIALMRAVHCHPPVPETPEHRRCRYAWTATVLSLCVVGATVHYWGALGVFFTFCVGMGAWLAQERHGFRLSHDTRRLVRTTERAQSPPPTRRA